MLTDEELKADDRDDAALAFVFVVADEGEGGEVIVGEGKGGVMIVGSDYFFVLNG